MSLRHRKEQTTKSKCPIGALLIAVSSLLLFASACETLDDPDTTDIVSAIPWADDEEHAYRLFEDSDLIGETVLTVERDGDTFVLTQRSSDDKGNVDMSTVVVDADTLKPIRGTRDILDEEHREVAQATYEDVDTSDCDSGRIVRIEEQIFDPPDESTPSVPRRAPLCLPEHSYDNDTSLFIWRTIPFEEGYLANYETILAGTRRTQNVRIEVVDRVTDTPAGEFDAWLVHIGAEGKTQRAWFSTDPDHRLLAYQNDDFTFEIVE
jgi:hypothetical protein